MTNSKQRVVDIHTHVYVPSYLQLLRERDQVPRILPPLDSQEKNGLERLVILPGEDQDVTTANGRPVTSGFYDVKQKLAFMDEHGIDISVISLANPWIDFLPDEASTFERAKRINEELQAMCDDPAANKRLYCFGVLPLINIQACIEQVNFISTLPSMRGVIMGTHGSGGKGLDDPALIPLFQAIADRGLVIFLHPHYGISSTMETGNNQGHVLQLALGFPMETTWAVTRMILSGLFDNVPQLKMLLAHSGGTLPFLAGRIDSCVAHDPVMADRLRHPPSWYLRKMYYDAVIYHDVGITATTKFAVDPGHVCFGTDHPFFPPLQQENKWLSVTSNLNALKDAELSQEIKNGILGDNAIRLFNLS